MRKRHAHHTRTAVPPPVVVGDAELALLLAICGLDMSEGRRYRNVAELWRDLAGDEVVVTGSIVVVTETAADSPDTLARALAYLAPRATVFLLARAANVPGVQRRYMQIAASDPTRYDVGAAVHVITTPVTMQRLTTAICAYLPASARATEASAAGTMTPGVADRRGRLLVLTSARGGTGVSTVTAMLAGSLARHGRRRVCVVDLDTPPGALATLLGLTAPTARTAEPEVHQAFPGLTVDRRLGVHLLCAPSIGDQHDLAGWCRDVLPILRRQFDVVLVDCPSPYRSPSLAAAALADASQVLVVTTVAATSLVSMTRLLRDLAHPALGHGLHPGQLAVVVNAALNGVGVEPHHVLHGAAGVPLLGAIPYAAHDVMAAANTHHLDRLLAHPDLGPAYRDIANRCAPDDAPSPPRRRARHHRLRMPLRRQGRPTSASA